MKHYVSFTPALVPVGNPLKENNYLYQSITPFSTGYETGIILPVLM
jgi:hypothetical protein